MKRTLLEFISKKVGVACNATTGKELLEYVNENMGKYFIEYGDLHEYEESLDFSTTLGYVTFEKNHFDTITNDMPMLLNFDYNDDDEIQYVCVTEFEDNEDEMDFYKMHNYLLNKAKETNSNITFTSDNLKLKSLNRTNDFRIKYTSTKSENNIVFDIIDDSADTFVLSIIDVANMFYYSSLERIYEFNVNIIKGQDLSNPVLAGYLTEKYTDIETICKQIKHYPIAISRYHEEHILYNKDVLNTMLTLNDTDYNKRKNHYSLADINDYYKKLDFNRFLTKEYLDVLCSDTRAYYLFDYSTVDVNSLINLLKEYPKLIVDIVTLYNQKVFVDEKMSTKICTKYKLEEGYRNASHISLFIVYEIISNNNLDICYTHLAAIYKNNIDILFKLLNKEQIRTIIKIVPNKLQVVKNIFSPDDELFKYFLDSDNFEFYNYAADDVKILYRENYLNKGKKNG